MPARLAAATPFPIPTYNVVEYGAIGDNVSHPISGITSYAGQNTTGWTLAQWQAKYGYITALTNEVSWLSIERAKRAAAIKGGTVYVPAGIYLCDQAVSDFPETGELGGGSPCVNLIGDGSSASYIKLTQELTGTRNGKFFINCANRATTTYGSAGVFRDFSIIGPASGFTFGQPLGFTSGIGWSSRRQMQNVGIQNFYAGLGICGDQTSFIEVLVKGCTYGVYFDVRNPVLFDDLIWEKCIFNGCSIASVAVAHTCMVGTSLWLKCITAASPFHFYKETNNGAPSEPSILHNTTFIAHQFEGAGISCISDDRTPFDSRCANNTRG